MREFPQDSEAKLNKPLVQRALGGEAQAVRELIGLLHPVIKRRALASLTRYGQGTQSEVEDVCQEVLIGLFREDRAALAAWDPERGLSLVQFVGMLAQRRVSSYLRSRANKPSRRTPTEPESLERLVNQSASDQLDPHDPARETFHELADRLRATLSPLGLEMFYRLYVWEHSTEQITAQLGLTAEAVYQWRSRLRKAALLALKELEHGQ
ncbi:MAG TPA: sigma factor [Polyangiaceae bacterium]|nr:sigma factor [Polyangiaceae bacterium]